jgi:pimeloyl-ACP methyl ester carboxylesterase
LTVLLLHAFPLDSRMWEETRARLEQAGYAVAAPDLPPAAEIGVEAWARRVLASVPGDLVPVGISMGGYLAFELWRQAPERIRALVLADTKAGADAPQARQARDDTISLLGEEGFDPFWEALVPKLFAAGASPDVVESARAIASEQPLTPLVTALETLRDRPDSHPTLPSINVPVLVVVGEEDELTPQSDADELEEQIRRARLIRIPGAGHLTPLERPDEFNEALLAFLQEVAS